jgi:hypothetical protein
MEPKYWFAVLVVIAVNPAFAQADRSFPACETQQQIEQVLGSKGQYVPSDCRRLTITKIQSTGKDVCILDFETAGDRTFLDRLRNAAVPTKWWVECTKLSAP